MSRKIRIFRIGRKNRIIVIKQKSVASSRLSLSLSAGFLFDCSPLSRSSSLTDNLEQAVNLVNGVYEMSLTHRGAPPTEELITFRQKIRNPLSIWCYEKRIGITHIRSRPRMVGKIWKKPTLVILAWTSPRRAVSSNTIARRRQKVNIRANRRIFHMYRLKFVPIFDNRQAVVCSCCKNSIKIQTDSLSSLWCVDCR